MGILRNLRLPLALVSVHVGLTIGAARHSWSSKAVREWAQPLPADASRPKLAPSPRHRAAVERVLRMYAGAEAGGAVGGAAGGGEGWAEGVLFEDPVMRSVGTAELAESFRALGALRPRTLDWELMVETPNQIELDVWQEYEVRGEKVVLYSRVLVESDDRGRVTHLVDRWNGVQLQTAAPFALSRRLNGLLAALLAPLTCDTTLG